MPEIPMSRATFEMPFACALRAPHGDPDGPARGVRIDRLAVSVESIPAATSVAAMRGPDGRDAALRILHGSRVYGADAASFTGRAPDKAAELAEAGLRRALAYEDPPIGRSGQRRARANFEFDALVCGGRLYLRDRLPTINVELGFWGEVGISTDILPEDDATPAWMRFPLDAGDAARTFGERLVEEFQAFEPDRDWSRLGIPTLKVEETGWRLVAPDALASIPLADGGSGSEAETDAAIGRDLARMLAPHIGFYPTDTVVAFADLRRALDAGASASDHVERLVRAVVDNPLPGGASPVVGRDMRIAAFCLDARLSIAASLQASPAH